VIAFISVDLPAFVYPAIEAWGIPLSCRRERFVYSGPRNSAPLSFREERGTRMSPWVFIQVRKTL